MQVTRDEAHTPTAFHANVVAMDKGHLTIEDVARDYVHCTQCGACELRCPNTLFTGDFYRFRTRTVDLVKAMRSLAVEHGVHQPGWQRWNELTDERKNEPVLNGTPVSQEHVARLGGRARPTRWRRDRPLLRLRGCLLPDEPAAGGGADPPGRRDRVRAHARAVVLRRARGRDGLRRSGAALRRTQRRRLARRRREADPRPRPARLHLLHRGLPALLRGGVRVRDRARRRARGGALKGWKADAFRPCREGRDLPRRLPFEQAERHPRGSARNPPGDSGARVQGRRPRHAVVVLLGRRRRASRSSGPT